MDCPAGRTGPGGGGALAAAAGPAQAGQWVNGGVYQYQSTCRSVGDSRVASGTYETYYCQSQSPGWLLRGYVN
ncbi:hypothetical protein [Micromonospora phaseoli]|uniref:hypothetical protein n=1 Tax=Micromonospora phaseoli TaxID=1144548 RepID=UPI000B86EA1B|nr:hypothetical protein [Micromonospora phaseoli]GIJ77432.1 hypothetical protein Xph01_18640 [Micromonospora phaseoli]